MSVIDPAERTRILTDLAQQQARQRDQHVTELADLYARLTALRAEVKTIEATYRSAYRNAVTTGLLTGPQLRSLGLPPVDARRRPRPTTTPTAATDSAPAPCTRPRPNLREACPKRGIVQRFLAASRAAARRC